MHPSEQGLFRIALEGDNRIAPRTQQSPTHSQLMERQDSESKRQPAISFIESKSPLPCMTSVLPPNTCCLLHSENHDILPCKWTGHTCVSLVVLTLPSWGVRASFWPLLTGRLGSESMNLAMFAALLPVKCMQVKTANTRLGQHSYSFAGAS